MSNVEKESLEQLKKNSIRCMNLYNSTLEKVTRLELNSNVKEYIKLKNQLNIILFGIEENNKKYEKILKKTCNHPLWYLKRYLDSSCQKSHLYECKCIMCQKKEINTHEYFKDKIIINTNIEFEKKHKISYDQVRRDFLFYSEKTDLDMNKIIEELIKKYDDNFENKLMYLKSS
ncbi:MAG TPA: hypothetical protein GX747_04930 [Tenericutes bacterium]|nr:hypothetical protein [Mycoplasmatota bacterium]